MLEPHEFLAEFKTPDNCVHWKKTCSAIYIRCKWNLNDCFLDPNASFISPNFTAGENNDLIYKLVLNLDHEEYLVLHVQFEDPKLVSDYIWKAFILNKTTSNLDIFEKYIPDDNTYATKWISNKYLLSSKSIIIASSILIDTSKNGCQMELSISPLNPEFNSEILETSESIYDWKNCNSVINATLKWVIPLREIDWSQGITSPEFHAGFHKEMKWKLKLKTLADGIHEINISLSPNTIFYFWKIAILDEKYNPHYLKKFNQNYDSLQIPTMMNYWTKLGHEENYIILICQIIACSMKSSKVETSEELQIVKAFCNNYENLLHDKTFSDIILQVEDQEIFAHKNILSAQSSVFHKIFVDNENIETFQINDFSFTIIYSLVRFIYTMMLEELKFAELIEMLSAAQKYNIESLKIKVEKTLSRSINTHNASDLLIVCEICKADVLKGQVIAFIANNAKSIQREDYEKIVKINANLLIDIIKSTEKELEM